MRQYFFGGLVALGTISGGAASAGGHGLLHHLVHSCRHDHGHCGHCGHCGRQPIVVHCCPPAPAGRMRETFPETAPQPQAAPVPSLIQASMPAFGYAAMPQMAVMPYPVGMPQAYPQPAYHQPETAKPRHDCCERITRLEDDLRHLSRDVDRLVDVVDRHSRVLDRLADYLHEQPDFRNYLESKSASPREPDVEERPEGKTSRHSSSWAR